MKSPEQIVQDVTARLSRRWSECLAAEAGRDESSQPRTGAWSGEFPLGRVTAADAERDFTALVAGVSRWRSWASEHGLELRWENRRILGTSQQVPSHLIVGTLDAAAALAGGPWPERLARGRSRAMTLAGRYPHLLTDESRPATGSSVGAGGIEDPAECSPGAGVDQVAVARLGLRRVLRASDDFTDVDFDLLCRAADWFRTHDAHGLTPRQVPVEGLHAKWLNTRQHLVRALANVGDLGLLPTHPPRIHFVYLDPDYRVSGGRLHDSATVGDSAMPAYRPRVVVVSENKDTALHFPPLPDAISVEGVGRGGGTVASFDWITSAEVVVYWGDMDADGLEILNEFRATGVPAVSILMDMASYEHFERFGTNHDAKGELLTARTPRHVPHLTAGESELYHSLVSPAWRRYRRIEQERLPLGAATCQVLSNVI